MRFMHALSCGEMSELAEGARLEIVCTPKRCTEGSNPSLSASPTHVGAGWVPGVPNESGHPQSIHRSALEAPPTLARQIKTLIP
jgi:hypothetical protein